MKPVFKSMGVILLCFMINALLSVLTDFLLESVGILPDPSRGLFETWAIFLVLFYRGAYTIFTGWLVLRWMSPKPYLHILILGFIGTVITLLSMNNPEFESKAPLWFGYTLAVITIPCLWLGVKIGEVWS